MTDPSSRWRYCEYTDPNLGDSIKISDQRDRVVVEIQDHRSLHTSVIHIEKSKWEAMMKWIFEGEYWMDGQYAGKERPDA